MRRCRVLLVHLGYSFGGVPTYVGNLAELLCGDVDLVCLCSFSGLAARLRRCGIATIAIPQWLGRRRILRTLVAPWILAYVVLRYRIDLVCLNGSTEGVLVLPARVLGCRVLYTVHMPLRPESSRLKPRISHVIIRTMLRFAHQVICVSRFVAEDVVRRIPPSRIGVVPNWVQQIPARIPHTKQQHGSLRLLFVGRLEPYKGASLILDAMRKIKEFPLSLTVVGDGTSRAALEKQAAGLDVRFAGFAPDPTSFYENADVFIHPTQFPEGSSLVSLEAMAHGVPCILSDTPVNREIADDGKLGLLFSVGDAGDLARKLMSLIESPDRRKMYGERARALVETKHSPSVARASYLELIQSLTISR